MKLLIIFIYLLISSSEALAKCTTEEINREYSEFFQARTQYLTQKTTELDTLLEEIKIKNNLSDKEIFDYRVTLLKDASTLKIKEKEPDIKVIDFLQLTSNLKCGKMMKIHKKLVKYADKQWVIIFQKARTELAKK